MGKIFYIMGKSSSGKDTIYENLLGREGLSLHPLIMYTTRPIRAGETDGVLLRAIKREKKQEHPNFKEVCRRYLADEEDFSEEKLQAAGITRRFLNNADREICMDKVASYIGTILEK